MKNDISLAKSFLGIALPIALLAALLIGGVFLLVSDVAPILRIRATGQAVEGTVMNLRQGGPAARRRPYVMTVLYEAEGQRKLQTLSHREQWRGIETGDTITLFYDPTDPSRVTTGALSAETRSTIMVLGVFAVLATPALLWVNIGKRARSKR